MNAELDRRTFLAALAAALVPSTRGSAAAIDRIGAQLYTVREALTKDFEGTLAKVASIGYTEVEFAGYQGRTPQQVRDSLKQHGLAAPAAHVDYPSVVEKWPQVLEAASTIGHTYLVNPWIDESIRKQPDAWKRIAETFNRAGEMSRKAGIQFAYHNHHFEFAPVDGALPFDTILTACEPALDRIELDL
jgi:sugar phosphate isomerase/epimerase